MPCFRQTSAADNPAACSFSALIICSSVNLLLRMSVSRRNGLYPKSRALKGSRSRSMAAYAGTYTIEGNQVIHRPDVSWNETWTGTDQVREYKFDGERLMLATSPSPNPFSGKMSVRSLVWEKIR